MMGYIRAIIRLILFVPVTVLTVVFVAVGNLIIGLFDSGGAVSWKNFIIRNWARISAFVIGMRLNKVGNPPEPPFFIVANHLSYIDVVPLWIYLDATFVAKSEIKSWPFFGWGTRTLGVLFIDRELKRDVHRMNQRISEEISDRQGVILFPEGTSTKGERVQSFNAPLLQYPVDAQMPVNYAVLNYSTPDPEYTTHLDVCWWGDMEFLPHFWNLLQLKGFEATITFGDQSIIADDRKKLAKKLHHAVENDFIPSFKNN